VCVKKLSSAISKTLPESTPNVARVMTLCPRYRLLLLTNPAEFQDAFRDLKVRKAPGSNVIPNRALKHLPRSLVFALVGLFNAIFRMHSFPPAWKYARVISILKPEKDPALPSSCRSISLLVTTGKRFEKILLTTILTEESGRGSCAMNIWVQTQTQHCITTSPAL